VLCSIVTAVFVFPASGGDRSTVVYTDPEVYTVSPGETVEMTVMVNSDGGYHDAGLETMTLQATYDTDYLTVASVEAGSYMSQGNETEIHSETAIDTENGHITIEQWRDPPRGGAIGNARFATITFTVTDDAPETNTTVRFGESRGALVGDYEVFVFSYNATISIDEDVSPSDQSSGPTGESGDSQDRPLLDGDAVGTSGFAILAGVGLIVCVGGVALLGRRSGEN
jgi:hypothetical protein